MAVQRLFSPPLGLRSTSSEDLRQVNERAESSSAYSGTHGNIPSKEGIVKSLGQATKVAQAFDRRLCFRFREEIDLYQVEVLELDGDEERIIRKIPPDEVINFIEHVKEMFGALIDVEA